MLSYGTMAETFKEQFAQGYQARKESPGGCSGDFLKGSAQCFGGGRPA